MSKIYIDTDTFEQLTAAADTYNVKVRADYSGRGMYDDTCIGFVYDHTADLIEFVAAVAGDFEELEFKGARQDSMGRAIIMYFPNWAPEDPQACQEIADDYDY